MSTKPKIDPYIQGLLDERETHVSAVRTIQARAAKDGRDLVPDERKMIEERAARLRAIDADLQIQADIVTGYRKYQELYGSKAEAREQAERRTRFDAEDGLETRGLGAVYTNAAALEYFGGTGESRRVDLPGVASPEFRAAIGRAAITTEDAPDAATSRWSGPAGYTRSTPLLDAVGRVPVTSKTVEYMYWGTADPTAAEVPEGELKPEADLPVEERSISMRTFAHYKPITRQALEDIPQIRQIVESKLLGGVANKVEQEAAAALTADATIPTATGDDLTSGIRLGIAQVEADGYAVNGVIVNPADAAQLDLQQLGNTSAGAVRSGSTWGVPIIPAAVIPAGTAYLGDLRQGVTWFDRGVSQVFVTDSHAELFIRNTLVILAETRGAFAVTEPAALVKVTAGAATRATRKAA